MRRSDIQRLDKPYGGDPSSPTPGPGEALGASTPTWQKLRDNILADLSIDPPYGISWWAPHPGTSRRILISDQLYTCAESVQSNLIEAAIHRLEFGDWSDKLSDRFANALRLVDGRVDVKFPRPESPMEELSTYMSRLHYVGSLRALAGALDCMAGTIVGVAALPTSILKADFLRVLAHAKRVAAVAKTEGERVQATLTKALEGLIDSAGPKGWLDWALAFRNMLVHRGRRIEIGQWVPREPRLFGADGQPVPRVRVVTHLPSDPGLSDVEVFLDPSRTPVLTEDVEQTLDGLLQSSKALIAGAARELIAVWNWRKAHPGSLPQPKEQWPSGPSGEATGFPGYAPGSFSYSPDMMTSHPVIHHRIRAAALDDEARPQWQNFD